MRMEEAFDSPFGNTGLLQSVKVRRDDPEAEKEAAAEEQAEAQAAEADPAAAAAAQEQPPAGGAPTAPPQAGGPQGKEAYERYASACATALYESEDVHAGVMQMLKAEADDPARAIAQATHSLVVAVDEQSGRKMPEDVILPVAQQVALLVAELGVKAGLFQIDQDDLQVAGQILVDLLGTTYDQQAEGVQEALSGMSEQQLEQIRAQEEGHSRRYAAKRGGPRRA